MSENEDAVCGLVRTARLAGAVEAGRGPPGSVELRGLSVRVSVSKLWPILRDKHTN